jgi:DNA-binding IclR family transcriptional regulator
MSNQPAADVSSDAHAVAAAGSGALDAGPAEPRRGEGGSQSIAAVERALDVLLLFGRQARPDLGVTEISGQLGLSKAAVHRILTSLKSRDLVSVDAQSRRYSLGPAALGLGRAYLARIDLRSMASPELAWLSAESRETATLSIRNGDSRMYVDQVVPDREVRMEVAIGVQYPLHAGSSSKAFLAFLTPGEIEAYVSRHALTAVTEATITDRQALLAELAKVRQRGYAVSMGERQAGAASVAAPILDQDGRPVAVVSVSGPIERFRDEVHDCAELLLQATGRLSARMGHAA